MQARGKEENQLKNNAFAMPVDLSGRTVGTFAPVLNVISKIKTTNQNSRSRNLIPYVTYSIALEHFGYTVRNQHKYFVVAYFKMCKILTYVIEVFFKYNLQF